MKIKHPIAFIVLWIVMGCLGYNYGIQAVANAVSFCIGFAWLYAMYSIYISEL